jgi:hypothetical protein
MTASGGPDGSLHVERDLRERSSKKLKSFNDESIFGPDIVMSKLEDAVHIVESTTDSKLIVEMVSTKTLGVEKYLELLKLLGFNETNCQMILHPTRIHSSRYRGSREVSQRESINALRAAMRVAIWYYFIDTDRRYRSAV